MQVGTRETGPGRVVLTPVGEIDMVSVPALEQAVDALLDQRRVVEIVIDLADVPFLDSTGVATLLHGAAEAVGRGATLRVANPQPVVARVLRITAVDALLGWSGDSSAEPGGGRLD
ncbi:STAS domain-containing protein [Micromonospora sp. RTP1Z1]|uniref:STAS domain-containing protein n=1 Tax=Micromonospora sp. RTP1Z1 TaxID=2994043 RepID=UPI0029C74AD9|nr:STAS domain-containing protein [Micromonospora sp. RTP1Z1]